MQRIVLVVSAVSALLMACPSSPKCTSSTQCGSGQSCVNGACVGAVGGGVTSTGGGTTGTGGGTSGTGGGSVTGGGSTAGGSTGGGTVTGAESCTMPGTAQAGATLTSSTTGAADDVDIACTGFRNPGPDRVYAVTVPAMMRLVATATPEMTAVDAGDQFDIAVYVVEGPAANCSPGDAGIRTNCLAGSDDSRDPAAVESATFLNTTAAAKEVFVVVDSAYDAPDPMNGITNAGNFSLRIEMAAPSMGDLCDSATAVTPGTLTGQSLTGFLPDYGMSSDQNCVTGDGADRVYSISVPAGQRLTATATPASDAGLDILVNLVAGPAAACAANPMVCLDGADSNGNGRAESTSYLNTGTAAQDVFVIVGNFDVTAADTNFSLTTTVAVPPPGDDCSMPTALTPGTPLTAQSFGTFVNDFGFGTSCGSPSSGPDRVYSVIIPQDKVVTVTVTPDAMVDTSVQLVDGSANCAPSLRCVASSPSAAAGMPDVVAWANRGTGAKTLLVLVDSSSTASGGAFSINAVLSDPPMGDYCSNATALTANTTVAGTTAGFNNDYTSSMAPTCAGFNTLGNDRVYSLTIPNGQRAKVTMVADAGFAPSLSLVAGTAADCEAMPRVCVASADSVTNTLSDGGFVPQPRTAALFNGSGAALTAFAIIDGPTGAGGQFSLGFTSAAPAVDDTCTTATTALGTTTLTNQTLRPAGVTFERDYTCATGTAPDRVYVAQAPANQRLQVTVTPTPMTMDAGFDPTLSIIDGPATSCDSATRRCVAGTNSAGRQLPESAGYSNVGAAKTVYVVVGATSDSPSVEPIFSLSASTTPVQAGDVCENATAVTSGMTLPTESVMSFFHDYAFSSAGNCRSGPGADRVYSISVGAGQTITARATPDMAADVVVNIVEGPAANCNASPRITCLASADRGLDGQEDVATWMNATGAAKSVFVVISNYKTGPMTYSFGVTVQ